MPILSITFEMGILHQVVVLKDSLPIFVIFAVAWVFAYKLLNRNLMTVIILENQIIEVSSLQILLELNIDVRLAWPLRFCAILSRYLTISLDNREFLILNM